jgi:hypothetical protein
MLCACAAPRLSQIRNTGATALQCSPDSLWVIDDGNGWSAAGCGQIASGVDPLVVSNVSPAGCESLAQFEFRMCALVARQRAVSSGADQGNVSAQAMENADVEQCRIRLKERTDTCLKSPPPRRPDSAAPAPAPAPEGAPPATP